MRLTLLTLFCLLTSLAYTQINDCADAVVICSNDDIGFNPNGAGIDDFADPDNGQGCIVALESNSAWYYFEIDPLAPPGLQLGFTISPNGGLGEDYDWAVFGPNVDCGNLGDPLRCSSASAMCDFCPETGIGMGAMDVSEGPGVGDGFTMLIDVLPGQGFYLLIDNWLGTNNGFVLTWTGTAADFLNCDAEPPCALTAEAGTDLAACEGDNPFSLTGSSGGNSGSETYEWSGSNGGTAYLDNPNSQNPNVTLPPGFSGSITYTLTVTDGLCIAVDDMNVTVNPLPAVSITPAGPFCENDPGFPLTASPAGGSWTGAPAGTFDPGTNGPGTHAVTYTYTDPNGCTNSATINIVVNSNPTVNISPDPATYCTSDGGVLLTATGAGGSGGYSFTWTTPNGTFTGPTHFAFSPGSYSVAVSDLNNCLGTYFFEVTENPNPLVTVIDPGPLCETLTSFQLMGAPSGGTWTGAIVQPDGTIFPSNTGPGTFDVTYTYTDGNNCSSSDQLFVNIVASPSSEPSNGGPYCEGETIELFGNTDGSGIQVTYQWTGPNGYSSNQQNPIDATDAGPYVLQVTVDGCPSDFIATTVDVTAAPDVAATNDGPYCPGQTIQLNGNTTSTGNTITYSWTGPNGYTSGQQNPDDATESGTYNLIITVDGCESSTGTTEVMFNDAPDAAASNTGPYCVGDGIELSASTMTNGTSITFSWTGPNGYTSDQQNPADATEPGTYTVEINVDGCISDPVETTVSINTLPDPEISGTSSFCEGATETLDAGVFSSYIWNDNSTNQTLDVTVSGTYSVTVTDGNGCTGVDNIAITVNTNPTPDITGSTSFCAGSSTVLDAGGGYDTYLWSDNSSNQTLEVSTTNTYSVTVTDANGCTGETSVLVEESSSLNIVISGELEYCAGESTTLDAGIGFDSYEWSDGTMNQTIEVTTPDDYTVTVSDAAGCTGEASVSIIENALPQVNISGNNPFCTGDAITLDAGNGFDQYFWSDMSTSATLDVNTGGIYSVTVTDANGCTNEAQEDVIENPNPQPIITGATAFCEGETITLSTGIFDQYAWSTGSLDQTTDVNTGGSISLVVTDANGCTGEDNIDITENLLPQPTLDGDIAYCAGNGTTISVVENYTSYDWSNGESTQTVNINTPGNISVIVTDGNGCTAEIGTSITENPNPEPMITGPTSFCIGLSTTLDAGAGFDQYLWSDGSTEQSLEVSIEGPYSVIVTDANGCTGEANVDVTESQALEPIIVGDFDICNGETTLLDAGAGFETYSWSNGETTQTITVNTTDDYAVTVSDVQGCTGETSVPVLVNPNPTAQINGDSEFCSGNTVTLDAGAGFDSYNWSDGSTSQTIDITTGDIYSVTVSFASGCTDETSLQITENPLPQVDITGATSFCTGNSTILDAGAGYTSYFWSNGATTQTVEINSGTNINVIVTDANGCTGTDDVVVTENASLTPSISGVLEFCEDGNTTLDAGAGYVSYQWSDGSDTQIINIDEPGSYTVIVTDADGCSGSDNVLITEFTNPTPVIAGSTTFCTGSFTTLDAGNYDSYSWSDGSTSQTIVVNTPGLYTVDVIDTNGCSGQASIDVTESTSLNPVISGTLAFCETENTILDAGAGFDSYLWSDGSMNQTLTVSIAADYSVTVSDATGCTGETTVSVAEIAPPESTLEPSTSLCNTIAGGSVINLYDLVLSGDTNGTWTDTDNSGAVGLFDALNFNNITAGDYTFTYTTSSATFPCTEVSYDVVITVIDCTCPSVLFFQADPLCGIDGSLDLSTITDTNEPGTWSIITTPGGGNPASVINNTFDATGSDAGNYTLQFQLTEAQPPGCPTEFFVDISVDPPVEAGTVTMAPAFCEEENQFVDLTGLLSGSDPNGVWTETSSIPSIGGAFDPLNGNFTTNGQASGLYTFEYSVSSTGACPDDIVEVSVNINELPTVEAGLDANINCLSPSTSLDASSSDSGIEYEIIWNGPGIILDGNENTLTPTIDASGIYTLTITNTQTGCSQTDFVQVSSDFESPIVATGMDQELTCIETEVNLPSTGDINPPFQIQWQGPGINTMNENDPTPQVDLPGMYIISVVNPANGCISNPDTILVIENIDPPTVVIQSALEEIDCNTTSADLIVDSPTPSVSFEWFDDQNELVGTSDIITGITEPGIYTVVVTNTATGCTNSDIIEVIDNTDFPLADAGNPSTLDCIETEATLDGSGSASGPEISFNWSGPGVSGPTDQDLSLANLPGTYTLTVLDNSNGCSSTDVVEIGENIEAPVILIGTPEQLDCTIEEVTLDGTGSSTGPEFTYTWIDPDGNIISSDLTTIVQTPGVYTLSIFNSENGCESTEIIAVIENVDIPNAAAIQTLDPDCFGDSNGLISIESVTGGTEPYVYSINGSNFSTDPIFANLPAGTYDIVIQDANGCELSIIETINQAPNLQIELGADLEYELGDSVTVEAIVNIPDFEIDTIIWTPADLINCNDPACLEVGLSTFNTLQVSATVIDLNGCSDQDEVVVEYRKSRDVFIPTAFSPNGDGANDHFTIFVNENQVANIPSFRIFNRWGEVVFEAYNFQPNDVNLGWDGSFKGERMNPGVFIYVAEIEFVDGRKQLYKGDVTLLK